MAEFRVGHDQKADTAFVRAIQLAETDNCALKFRPPIRNTSRFYRVMIHFRTGKPAEARELFRQTLAEMTPLPEGSVHTLPADVDFNQLSQWLACREARALLGEPNRD